VTTTTATRLWVRTRGTARRADYAFLGARPESPWWDDYADVLSPERPSLLVRSDGRRWQVFVSGVPSERRDSVQTLIVYTLVLEGEAGDDLADLALRLAAAWLGDLALDGQPYGRVSEALDSTMPAADVDAWLAAVPEDREGIQADVVGRVREVLEALPEPATAGTAPEAGHDRWLAGVALDTARAAFLGRVTSLLRGAIGEAHVLNMIEAAEDVAEVGHGGSLAVLVEGRHLGDAELGLTRIPVPAKGTASTASDAGGPDPKALRPAVTGYLVRLLLPLVGVVAVGALIWWWIRTR
jgi:hypothetical protein